MNVVQRMLLGLIRAYQLTFSLFLGKQCRFHPTCSHYTADAIRIHGAAAGTMLGMRRIARCHPFNPGGHDPVPASLDCAKETCS